MLDDSSSTIRRQNRRMMFQERSSLSPPSLLSEVRSLTALILQDHDEYFHSASMVGREQQQQATNGTNRYSLNSILTEALELSNDLEREIQLLNENDE